MDLTPEQRRNIKKVIRRLNKKDASPMEKKAAIETIGVEKNYIHTAGGDRDSGGAYQQRPSQGWGPAGESIQKDTDQFLAAARNLRKTGDYSTAGELAAAVQRPAEQYRGRYQERSAEADRILARFDNGGSANGAAKYSSPSVQSTPGVDNAPARQQLQQSYLLDRGKPDALLSLARGLQGAQDVAPTTTLVPGQRLTNGAAQPVNGPKGPAHALDWAKSKVGFTESGTNSGGIASKLNQRFGMNAQPWCAMFTSAAVTRGGAPSEARTASVAEVRRKAQSGEGYRGFVDPARAKAGDLILWQNSHIGMVESVSGGKIHYVAGNESDGVNEGTADPGEVDVVRPKYGTRKVRKK